MLENIHTKARMMEFAFAINRREVNDRHIDANFRNTLSELQADTATNSAEIVMGKLLLLNIALNMAQNLGIDYHVATEKLYYDLRKKKIYMKNLCSP
jgi:hypothetical protein